MSQYTKQVTVHLNILLHNELKKASEDINMYADKVLSEYFGITHEEAYPNCTTNNWQEQ